MQKIFTSALNENQIEALKIIDEPVLILAGAGSGKTRVITHKIAYLIKEHGYSPYSIFAVTFTNKAAQEMKDRVSSILDKTDLSYYGMWVSTFHSACARILRTEAHKIGYTNNFTIYDTDDSVKLIKEILVGKSGSKKEAANIAKRVHKAISFAKNKLNPADEDFDIIIGNSRTNILDDYIEYEKRLKKCNALDFDNLILKTIELFKTNPDTLNYYRNIFKYVLVDEFQDTNNVQYELIKLLCMGRNNISVVGDDDQSIYSFRGADFQNVFKFTEDFENCNIIRLEKNYRSTENILNAANKIIENNKGRMGKTLWTENEKGENIRVIQTENEKHEAEMILKVIRGLGTFEGNTAVFYRTNARSRALEEILTRNKIVYQIFGTLKFYQRKEIKDIIAYLNVVVNPNDDISFKRVIGLQKGIGNKTIEKIQKLSDDLLLPLFNTTIYAIDNAYFSTGITEKLKSFIKLITGFIKSKQDYTPSTFVQKILDETNFENYINSFDNSEERKENIIALLTGIHAFEQENPDAALDEYLQRIALYTDMDNYSDETKIFLMTVHNAKGLEFDNVIISGAEDGSFPHYLRQENLHDVEEERRLFYVAITRAKKRVVITHAKKLRDYAGFEKIHYVSRFIRELDSGDESYYYSDSPEYKKPVKKYSWAHKTDEGYEKSNTPQLKPEDIAVGDLLVHDSYGQGKVTFINYQGKAGELTTIKLLFKDGQEKIFVLKYSNLTRQENT